MFTPYHRDYRSVNKPLLSALVFSFVLLLFTMGLVFPSGYAVGSGQPQNQLPAAPPVLTIDALRERIDIVNKAPNLSPEAKEKITSFCQKAIDSLRRREKAISQASEYTEELKKAPKPGNLADKAIAPVRAAAIEQRARAMALTEIEGEIARFQAQLAQEQTELELAKSKLNDIVGHPAVLRKAIATYGHELADLEKRLAHPKPSDESPRVIRARRISLRAKRDALKAELAAAEKQADLSKRQMLAAQNQQALTARKVNRLEALIKTWKEVRQERQTDVGFIEFRQSTAVLKQMDKKTWPKSGDFLRKLAERNLAISKTLIELGEKESDALKTEKLLDIRLTQIKRDFEFTKNRIKLTGLSRKSGQLLQSRRSTLLTSRANSHVAQKRRNEILNTSLASDDLLQERQNFLVFKGEIYNQLDNIDADLTQSQNNMMSTQAFLILESYRKLLEETGKSYTKHLKTLNSQEAAQKK